MKVYSRLGGWDRLANGALITAAEYTAVFVGAFAHVSSRMWEFAVQQSLSYESSGQASALFVVS